MKIRSYRNRLRPAFLLLPLLVLAVTAHAGTVTGVVHNGTNKDKPASGVDVLLIQLQGGMQTVGTTKTDADGRYHFDSPGIGAGPMLVRAVYRGVNFNQPLRPGMPTLDLTVYEPTTNSKAMQVPLRLLVFQPNGDKLMVGEEFSVENKLDPPAAFYKQDGNFDFTIPEGAELGTVSTFGPLGMPLTQGTIDKGKGHYSIAYAFQPGKSGVRLSYVVPYSGDRAALRETSPYDTNRVMLVIPPSMQVSSPGFSASGTEQGFNVFSKESIKAGAGIDISVSGTAPPPSDASGSADQVNGRDSGPAPTVETAPARLGNEKWILLGGLAAIFAVGVGLLLRQPIPAVASGPVQAAQPPMSKSKARKAQREAQAQAKSTIPAPPLAEKVNQEVNSNLESLKDTLLRIELRRQAGTISEQEYAQERDRAERMLRDLVQG